MRALPFFERQFRQAIFLRNHLHLMVPGLYTADERKRADAALLRLQWDRASPVGALG